MILDLWEGGGGRGRISGQSKGKEQEVEVEKRFVRVGREEGNVMKLIPVC